MYKILQSDIYAALNSLADNSIDIAITSPPYWRQRNYGFENQIGSEKTYLEFISRLVYLFNILKVKLSDKGIFFLNIGDKYLPKYGKTPLGLIPYKLAYFMQQAGWIINDTIIWYKPNRMPSSVKNRFVNAHEPVFVLSKRAANYFSDFIKSNSDYSNIIDVNLQPTPYKHVATYPEKLVEKLLDFTRFDRDFTVLDPFAGSGTTLKVINNRNNLILSKYKAKGIMIEYNSDYIDLIKKRTKLEKLEVEKLNCETYHYPLLSALNKAYTETASSINLETVNIFETENEFYAALNTIENQNFIAKFPKHEIIFVGLKTFSIAAIYHISLLKNWVIRNQLIVRETRWYPIFMLVHDNKTHRYNFDYKAFALNHKLQKESYFKQNFIGYNVENKMRKQKQKGLIIEVIESYKNGLPKYVKVLWNTKVITKEFVLNTEEPIENNLRFHKYNGYISVQELDEIISLNNVIEQPCSKPAFAKRMEIKPYRGKFKDINRQNWGASPGARSSVEEEFFTVQRLYEVNQNLVADYLNHIRKQHQLSKTAFAALLPDSYKHTVGHWLRKDFGGSIPIQEDWGKLENLFEIDPAIKNYACKTGLKLQAVTQTKYKIPDDVISPGLIENLEHLNRSIREKNYI